MLQKKQLSQGRVHRVLQLLCFCAVCELGVTGGIISSVKILLSWYFDNMIRLIINAECAVWPFM